MRHVIDPSTPCIEEKIYIDVPVAMWVSDQHCSSPSELLKGLCS